MLSQCLRRWSKIKTTLAQRFVLAGLSLLSDQMPVQRWFSVRDVGPTVK